MNIFVLDLDPTKCAQYHCDKHLVKMITEHNQILGSIAYTARGISKKKEICENFIKETFSSFPRRKVNGDPYPYGIGYANHQCTKWAAQSIDNYKWLTMLNSEMCKEYTLRYNRIHAGEAINRWYELHYPDLPNIGLTPFAQAMPDECKNIDAVKAYRDYYIKYKSRFAKWSTETPNWFKVNT